MYAGNVVAKYIVVNFCRLILKRFMSHFSCSYKTRLNTLRIEIYSESEEKHLMWSLINHRECFPLFVLHFPLGKASSGNKFEILQNIVNCINVWKITSSLRQCTFIDSNAIYANVDAR